MNVKIYGEQNGEVVKGMEEWIPFITAVYLTVAPCLHLGAAKLLVPFTFKRLVPKTSQINMNIALEFKICNEDWFI